MIYDSTHDFLYTALGICVGFLRGMFYLHCKYYKELKKGDGK